MNGLLSRTAHRFQSMPWCLKIDLKLQADIGHDGHVYLLTAIIWPPHDKCGPREIEYEQLFEAVKKLLTRCVAITVRNDGYGTRVHTMH